MNSKTILQVCRACLGKKPSAEFRALLKEPYRGLLYKTTHVYVEEDTRFPLRICLECVRKCTLWLEFRERVENNDKLLHSIINGEAIELPFPEEKSTKRPLGEESELDDSADDLIVTKSDSKTKHSLIRCPVEDCGRELVGFRKFEDHCLTHITSTTNIRCPICRLVYKRSDNFRKHMYVHTNQKFQCSDCDRWFNNPKSLNDHLRIVHKIYARDDPEDRRCKGARNTIIPEGIKCPVCQLELKSFKEYDEHINTHISREDRSCPVCQKKINHFGNLKGHIYSHTDVKFTCQFCPEKFVHPKKYRNHIKVMHKKEFYYAKNEDETDEEGEFPTNCILCLNSILTKEELIAHMLEEHPDEQKLCTKCGITLSSEHELKEHSLKKHSGDWIDCDECDQKFNSVSLFREHKRIHRGEKRNQCEKCGMSFRRKTNLTAHIKDTHRVSSADEKDSSD